MRGPIAQMAGNRVVGIAWCSEIMGDQIRRGERRWADYTGSSGCRQCPPGSPLGVLLGCRIDFVVSVPPEDGKEVLMFHTPQATGPIDSEGIQDVNIVQPDFLKTFLGTSG